jgi:hypothetical protein
MTSNGIRARVVGSLAVEVAGCASGVEAGDERVATGEQHVDALADRSMTERLSKVGLADADVANDEDGGAFGQVCGRRRGPVSARG